MSKAKVTIKLNKTQAAALIRDPKAQHNLDALADAALDMQKSLVSVDTGNLRKHLGKRNTSDGVGREVGAFDVDYAAAVEDGHRTKKGTMVPAQPYVRPSMDAVRRRLSNG